MSQRKQQRESVLLRAIQEVFSRGFADPRIRGLITVTGIKLSDDGKNATVLVSVLPEDRQELTMHGLKAASGKIRKDAMQKVRLKDMPHLEFAIDGSIKEQAELLRAINKASETLDTTVDSPEPVADAGSPVNDHPSPIEPDGDAREGHGP
jgi:ribosome-binding factor A